MTTPINISKQTARRFVLGKQGLWPGRRWMGKKGTADAIKACEAVQLDPLNVIARSQDIVLHSRVLDYKPEYLYKVAYDERKFFDYGGWLAMYPMSDLPYWRYHMQRHSHNKRIEGYVLSHESLFEQVRHELRTRGPLGNRDLNGNKIGTWNYRGRKDTSLALYDMWLSGELMMHHRVGFDRVYDFRENIAPKEFDYVATEEEAEEFFARKAISFMGLKNESKMRLELRDYLRREYSQDEMKKVWGEKYADVLKKTNSARTIAYSETFAMESVPRVLRTSFGSSLGPTVTPAPPGPAWRMMSLRLTAPWTEM
jgi:hypothetical protein